jgi:ABC-2 type transport system ATP-binding protein
MPPAITLCDLSHRYGERLALSEVSLEIASGEIFGVLGPNGSGKSTLFRLLSTLMPVQQGSIQIAGCSVSSQTQLVQRKIGVVFQSSSLDKKLTVAENIRYQAALYGLSGRAYALRETALLEQFQLRERANELCERLSGGLRRRVEIAKGLVHEPEVLLLDEPSTGLDPAARLDLWQCLTTMRAERGVTVVLTTHLLDEAAKADRLAIFDQGRLVALDTPTALQATVGGDTILLRGPQVVALAPRIREQFQLAVQVIDAQLRVEVQRDGHLWIPKLVEAFPNQIEELSLGKPTLEDVFIAKTGHRFVDLREVA